MTGEQYRRSLADGRSTYFEGDSVTDFDANPVFDRVVRHVAVGYDEHYSPEPDAVNPLLLAPTSREDLRTRVPQMAETDILTHTTNCCVSTLRTVAARIGDRDPEKVERMQAFADEIVRRDVRMSECITDAKGDRSKRPSDQSDPDAYLRVVDRSSDGVVIRGAKLHITGASFGHEMLVMPTKAMHGRENEYAVACAVPVNAPGVHVVNVGPAPRADDVRHYPVSSSRTVLDGFVIFDDVFVPNERVFNDDRIEFSSVFAHSLGLWERLGSMARSTDDADALVGLAMLIADANGLARVSHIKAKIDDMLIYATMLRASLEAAIANADHTEDGYWYPSELYINAGKTYGMELLNTMVRNLHDIAGGSVSTAPSLADLDNPKVGPLIRKYMATSETVDGEYRTRLFHTIRDLTADAYGGQRMAAKAVTGGGLLAQRLVARKHYDADRARARALAAVYGGIE